MWTLKYEIEAVQAMAASIKNFECYAKDTSKNCGIGYILKYFFWEMLLALLSPKLPVRSKRMVCAMTPLVEKQMKPYMEHGEYVCFSKLNGSISQMRRNRSVLSPYSRGMRLLLMAKGAAFYVHHHAELKGYLHFTVEYYMIAQYLWDYLPEEIYSPNSYERYCTLLSYLGHSMGIRLVGIQDGVIMDIHPPVKLYCDEMHAFDGFEADIFRRSIIRNDDCLFLCDGFRSMLKWADFPKNGKKLIAIASQDSLTERTMDLVDNLLTVLDPEQYIVIIYPHYREKAKQYDDFSKKHPFCCLETSVRHRNVDLLITFYSTIVYDFWSVNSQLPVICLHIPGHDPTYYQRENVTVCDSVKEVITSVSGGR